MCQVTNGDTIWVELSQQQNNALLRLSWQVFFSLYVLKLPPFIGCSRGLQNVWCHIYTFLLHLHLLAWHIWFIKQMLSYKLLSAIINVLQLPSQLAHTANWPQDYSFLLLSCYHSTTQNVCFICWDNWSFLMFSTVIWKTILVLELGIGLV